MFNIKKMYFDYMDKEQDQDPIKILKDGAFKSAFLIFSFLFIANYFKINLNLVVVLILFILNLTASCLLGSIETKRRVFMYYMIAGIIIVNVSPFVHDFFRTYPIAIVSIVFFAFWVRKFGDDFLLFPLMLLVLTCICFIRFPLDHANNYRFTIDALCVGIMFYVLFIHGYKVLTPDEIHNSQDKFYKQFISKYSDIIQKSSYKAFAQTKVLNLGYQKFQSIISMQTHGLMFLPKSKHECWRYYCSNITLFNRLCLRYILNYRRLCVGYGRMGFKSNADAQTMIADLEKMFKVTLSLLLSIKKDKILMLTKLQYVENQKYDFEMKYMKLYSNDSKKKEILFKGIILLDDMIICLKNIKGSYDDVFLKRID